jgi:hypothetical protein
MANRGRWAQIGPRFGDLTPSMPWWPDKLRRRARAVSESTDVHALHRSFKPGAPFVPRTRALQGESRPPFRRRNSPRRASQRSIRSPVVRWSTTYVRSNAADAEPICAETSSRQNAGIARMCSSSAKDERDWFELHIHMQAARNQRERGSPQCAASANGYVSQGRHREPAPVAPHRLPSDLTLGWVESREPGEL